MEPSLNQVPQYHQSSIDQPSSDLIPQRPKRKKAWIIASITVAVIVILILIAWYGRLENEKNKTNSQNEGATLSAQGNDMSTNNTNNSESAGNYMLMQSDSGEYKDLAYKIVAEAAKNNVQYLKDNFSPNAVAANPPGALDAVLLPAVQTFFSNFDHVGDSVTIQPSTDHFGSSGYSFAMTAVYKDGSETPFKIYVVKEGGKLVVGNILVTKQDD